MSDNKSILIKLLKVMAAYFGLYVVHYIIAPNSFLYILPGSTNVFMYITFFLFPIFDILYLKSNIIMGFVGIYFYSFCVYIYDADAAYGLGDFMGYSKDMLLFHLEVMFGMYLISYILIFTIIYMIKKIINYHENRENAMKKEVKEDKDNIVPIRKNKVKEDSKEKKDTENHN